jgi:outer membrane immunogenic protein
MRAASIIMLAVFLATTGAAAAADLASKAPAHSTYNWSGAYAGLYTGYSWGDGAGAYFAGGSRIETANLNADGFLIGGQAGYNWQFGSVVAGIEGDLAFSNGDGDGNIYTFPGGVGPVAITHAETNFLGSITGRVGYAADRALFYAKGGVGFTRLEITDISNAGFHNANGKESIAGWTLGAGVEYALNNNWTIKSEYQFYRFSPNVTLRDPVGGVFRNYNDDFNIQAIKVGFNYKF